MTVNSKDEIFVAMDGSKRILKFTSSDPNCVEYFAPAGDDDVRGLAFDSNGVLYSISRTDPKLYRYTEYNGTVTRAVVAGSSNGYVDGTGSSAKFYEARNIIADKHKIHTFN